MNFERKAFRLGVAVLIGAILLRLLGGLPDNPVQPRLAQVLLFLQTGRFAGPEDTEVVLMSTEPETQESTVADRPEPTVFTAEDAAFVQLRNTSGYSVDTAKLLTQPLNWSLTGPEPTVLILHTHSSESYADTAGFRSQDENRNMLAIGDRLASQLEEAGISVIHDRTAHDAESYNGSYAHARTSLEQYLSRYPTIRLVLDLHRDAAEDADGNQINYTVDTPEGQAAKLMLVMGTDAGGLTHPAWQDNLSLAVKLHAQLQRLCPEICRPLQLRTSRFNQDLSPGALLVEVGAAGNTMSEALLATDILAQGIITLTHGANLQ